MEINNVVQLREAIAILQAEKELNKKILLDQFHDTYDSLKPVNLIKSAFHKVTQLPDIANKVIATSAGLGAGVLSKKILVGNPTNIFKRIFGLVLELVVAGAVTKNADGIKRQGSELIKKLIKESSAIMPKIKRSKIFILLLKLY